MKHSFAILLFFSPILCFGQRTIDEMIGFLTNEKSRVWILGNYQASMGGCGADGHSFTFFKDGELNWKVCKDGKATMKVIEWKVKELPGSYSGYEITFTPPIQLKNGEDISSMRLDFDTPKKNASNKKMIWRKPTSKKEQEPQATLLSQN